MIEEIEAAAAASNSNFSNGENIKVIIRIRSLQKHEQNKSEKCAVKSITDGKEVQVKVGALEAQTYRCNQCFPRETTQEEFFKNSGITDLLDSAMGGYRSCAFAFGQTGAGKTFTVVGPSNTITPGATTDGLIGRSLEYVFSNLNSLNIKFTVRLSCYEIYHEHVYDLLVDDKEKQSLQVREHAIDGFFIEGCIMQPISSYAIACARLETAMKQRQVGAHDMNSRSNRSHCITDIYIELPGQAALRSTMAKNKPGLKGLNDQMEDDREYTVMGKMSLVDLAGSERLKSTNSTGKVLVEAGFINRSLYVLGKVIAGLVRTSGDLNHKDVPYRDSKLTKLLISSLGGKSRTMLIACVTEASGSLTETLRTLKFSMSCARIKNRPIRFLDPHEKLILELRDEIKRLKNENKRLRYSLITTPADTIRSDDGIGETLEASNLIVNEISALPNILHQVTSRSEMKAKTSKTLKKSVSKENVEPSSTTTILGSVSASVLGTVSSQDISNIIKKSTSNSNTSNNNSDDRSVSSINTNRTKKRNNLAKQVENIMLRRGGGPVGSRLANLGPVKTNKRHSELSRLEILEERILKIEKQEEERLLVDKENANSNINQSAVNVRIIEKELSKKKMDKDLVKKFGGQVLPWEDDDKPIKRTRINKEKSSRADRSPQWKKKAKGPSPYVAHLVKQPKEKAGKVHELMRKLKSEEKERQERVGRFVNEDEEIKLHSAGPTEQILSHRLPVVTIARGIKTKSPSKLIPKNSEETLPVIKNKVSSPQKKIDQSYSNIYPENVYIPVTPPSLVKSSPKKYSPSKSVYAIQNRQKLQEESTAIQETERKLKLLLQSLTQQRNEMEDNPGDVTDEREQEMKELEQEVKEMRIELDIARELKNKISLKNLNAAINSSSNKKIPIVNSVEKSPVKSTVRTEMKNELVEKKLKPAFNIFPDEKSDEKQEEQDDDEEDNYENDDDYEDEFENDDFEDDVEEEEEVGDENKEKEVEKVVNTSCPSKEIKEPVVVESIEDKKNIINNEYDVHDNNNNNDDDDDEVVITRNFEKVVSNNNLGLDVDVKRSKLISSLFIEKDEKKTIMESQISSPIQYKSDSIPSSPKNYEEEFENDDFEQEEEEQQEQEVMVAKEKEKDIEKVIVTPIKVTEMVEKAEVKESNELDGDLEDLLKNVNDIESISNKSEPMSPSYNSDDNDDKKSIINIKSKTLSPSINKSTSKDVDMYCYDSEPDAYGAYHSDSEESEIPLKKDNSKSILIEEQDELDKLRNMPSENKDNTEKDDDEYGDEDYEDEFDDE